MRRLARGTALAETALEGVTSAMEPGATVRTDGWRAYLTLPDHGYVRERIVMTDGNDLAHSAMPAAHRVASLLKRWLLGTHQGSVSPQHSTPTSTSSRSGSTAATRATVACSFLPPPPTGRAGPAHYLQADRPTRPASTPGPAPWDTGVKRTSVLGDDRELPSRRPVLVIHLVNEHLNLLGTDSVRIDERLGDAGHESALWFEVTRRLLDGHDGHVQGPFGGWSAAAPASATASSSSMVPELTPMPR